MAESLTRGSSFTRGGNGRSQSLESLLGADQAALVRSKATLDRLTQQAQALDVQDPTGESSRGFLTAALDYLTRPQSAVLGALTGLTGNVQEGEPTNPFARAAAALTGRERYTGSDLIGQAGPEAGNLERFLRAAGGFGIDVATDPLTYLTAGRGGVLRGPAAAAATEAQVTRAARGIIPPKPVEVSATPAVAAANATELSAQRALGYAERKRTSTQPVVRLGDEATIATQAPEIRPVLPTFRARQEAGLPEISEVMPQVPRPVQEDEFVTRLAAAAGEGQIIGGGRGVRDALRRTLEERVDPAEATRLADQILAGTTGEVRGGLGIRAPFLGRTAAGEVTSAGEAATRRLVDLTPGGGKVIDDLGLRGMAEAARTTFNDYRSSAFFRRWSTLMNGRFGAEYADFIRNSVKGGGGIDYNTFKKLVATDSKRTAALFARDATASAVIQTASKMVEQSADPAKSKAAFEKYFLQGDNMVLDAAADDAERVGFEAAAALREHGEGMFDAVVEAAQAAGVEIGNLREVAKNYVPRPITLEEARWRAARGKATGKFQTSKKRKVGFDTDQYGRVESVANDVLNQRFIDEGLRPAGHKVFETNPTKVAAQQYASYSEFLSQLDLIADLKATGLLAERTAQAARLVNVPALVTRGARIEDKLAEVADRLSTALIQAAENNDTEAIDRIGTALTKIAADGATIRTVLANIQSTDPDAIKSVGNLMKILKSALAAGEEAGITLTAAQKKSLFSRNGLITAKATGGNLEELVAAGLQPIGFEKGIRLPRGLDNLYADETVKDAVEKYFKIETGGWKDTVWFNEVYMPYYTLFKTFATVGRPGGYHLRNLQGGWWNNYLGDVSANDHKVSASVQAETKRSKAASETAIQNLRAGKASGLEGEADQIAKDIVALGRARGSDVVDYEVSQLADYLLYQKLAKTKIGDTTLADVLVAANEQGILRGNRRLEYLRDQARLEGSELADALLAPNKMNVFRGRRPEELNKTQQIVNKAANLRYLQWSGNLADMSENYLRLAAFISGARRYGISDGGTAAGYLTKALQFDYADLSDFERNILKNIIPFYTWTRRNLPLQFFALLNQPGKFNKLDFAKEELQSQFGAEGDAGPMNEIVPEWMREKMGFVTKFQAAGGPLTIAGPGFEAPAFDLNRYLAVGGMGGVVDKVKQEVVSASNPLAKAVVEGMVGIDTFTGGKFPEEGVASPLGSIPIPGSFVIDGERRINAQGYNMLKDLVPPLGVILRLSGRGNDADRVMTNWLSSIGGAPVSTLSVGQVTAELRSRQDRLELQVAKAAGALGVDRDWLRTQLDNGLSSAEIRAQVAAGNGRPA